jgi:Ca2+-binding RTX toxin-like protein
MTQLVISHMNFKADHAGADNTSPDDPYLLVNGIRFDANVDVFGSDSGTVSTGNTGTFTNLKAPPGVHSNGVNDFFDVVAANKVTFKLYDEDSAAVDGAFAAFFEGGDDFIGQTSYTANGNEPLFVSPRYGLDGFFFNNIMTGSGSKYTIDYRVNQLPGSTTGKLASKAGGVMQGSNKDGTLVGLNGKDIIFANAGDDLIDGGGNSDTANGGKGDDLIFGGKGKFNDSLSGGAGSDLFVVGRNLGLDTIKDFRSGQDVIGLTNGLTFGDLQLVQKAKGTLVKAGGEQLAFLQGARANQLSASDFSQTDLGSLNSLVKHDLAALKGA